MNPKKELLVYQLLLVEGTTEANLFAYLVTNKYREHFKKSKVRFSDKVEIIKNGKQIVTKGNLNGVGHINDFRASYNLIKAAYPQQKRFFVIDNDLDDSFQIGMEITESGDTVQFLTHNSEYLLLKFAGKNPKEPSEFPDMKSFRDYAKSEFENQFNKKASAAKDPDFDVIFSTVSDQEVISSFKELFELCEIVL